MPTEKEIKESYKAIHDELSERYYNGTSNLTKAEFDIQHGQIWTGMKSELIAGGHIIPSEPPRDFVAEIDTLKTRITALEPKEV